MAKALARSRSREAPLRAWLQHHRFSFAQTVSRLAGAPVATFLNMLVIGVALALPLGGYTVLGNLEPFSRNVSTESQLSVFLAADAAKNDAAAIEARLKGAQGVRAVRFVDRNSALTGLKRSPGMAEVIATLRDNPLPDAFVVTLAASDPELAERLERQFRALPKVAHVQVDSAWLRRLDTLLRLGRTTVALLGALLGLALVAVTFNTIRLQILTQRDEIEVSRLIGATRAYVQRPFIYLGSFSACSAGSPRWGSCTPRLPSSTAISRSWPCYTDRTFACASRIRPRRPRPWVRPPSSGGSGPIYR